MIGAPGLSFPPLPGLTKLIFAAPCLVSCDFFLGDRRASGIVLSFSVGFLLSLVNRATTLWTIFHRFRFCHVPAYCFVLFWRHFWRKTLFLCRGGFERFDLVFFSFFYRLGSQAWEMACRVLFMSKLSSDRFFSCGL